MSSLVICPECGKVIGYNSHFQSYYCSSCGFLGNSVDSSGGHKWCWGKCDRCVWKYNGGCSEWFCGGVLLIDKE